MKRNIQIDLETAKQWYKESGFKRQCYRDQVLRTYC